MDHVGLAAGVLSAHAAVLVSAVAAYYKYGDRTEVFTKSLQGTEALLRAMKQRLLDELERHLEATLEGGECVPSPILRPDGNTYVERPVNPIGSERWREALADFVQSNAGTVADYSRAVGARDSWCVWSRRLSWSLLALLCWQILVAGAVGIVDRVCGVPFPGDVLGWSFVPTVLIILNTLFCLAICLARHDTICSLRNRYDAP